MESLKHDVTIKGLHGGEKKRYTDEFFFFSKFFHNFRPDLEEEFKARVVNSTGFIDWNFVAGSNTLSEDSTASAYLQYKAVLKKVIDELQKITLHEYESLLLELSNTLRGLRILALKIVGSRTKQYVHFTQKHPNHREEIIFQEEVLNLWREIKENILILESTFTYRENNSVGSTNKYSGSESKEFSLIVKIIFFLLMTSSAIWILPYVFKLILNYYYPPPPPPSNTVSYLFHMVGTSFQKLHESTKKILR